MRAPPSGHMKGGISTGDVENFLNACKSAYGDRGHGLLLEDGKVNWNKYGISAFAVENGAAANGSKMYKALVEPKEFEKATHVYHKFAKVGVSLASLGVSPHGGGQGAQAPKR